MKEYKLIRSKRKTISITVTKDLEIIVRAPLRANVKNIDDFVLKSQNWIAKQLEKMENRSVVSLSESDITKLKDDARDYIPIRVEFFEKVMGVKCSGIKITSAKTRWGSCSYKNNLCFSYKIMLLSPDLIDYIVVHELAHILEKNHSKNFYAVIEKFMPDYKQRIVKLKKFQKSFEIC